MDKEKVVTIVLGLVVGIVLAAGYFFGSKFFLKPQTPTPKTKQTISKAPLPKTPQAKKIALKIDSPENNSSTQEKSIKVAGSFGPNSQIILFGNADEKIATSNAQGKFSFDAALEEGENEIVISSFDQNQKLVSLKRNVTREVSQ